MRLRSPRVQGEGPARARSLQKLATKLFESSAARRIYDTAMELEKQMARARRAQGHLSERRLLQRHRLREDGHPDANCSRPCSRIARVAGWLAHLLEQLEDNRIFRPSQVWVGDIDRVVVPIEQRG